MLISPILPPLINYELIAKLTPFWRARRIADEVIQCDRKLIRESRNRRDPSGSPEADRRSCIPIYLNERGFYYVWNLSSFSRSHSGPGSRPVFCNIHPLLICPPDAVIRRSKLRCDQKEYLDRMCREYREYHEAKE